MSKKALGLLFCGWFGAACGPALAAKDQSRIDGLAPSAPPAYEGRGLPGLTPVPDDEADDGEPEAEPNGLEPGYSEDLQHFPPIETIELSRDIAQRALDGLEEVRTKYDEAGLAEYETLEEFVAKTEAGKALDADIKRFGFDNVTQWNAAILSIEFAYAALAEGNDAEIQAEIAAVHKDASLPKNEREALLKGLEAMLSTAQNKKVVRELLDDANYAVKIRYLDELE